MNYPLYSHRDIAFAGRDGETEIGEFQDFLQSVVKAKMIEGTELGIVSYVLNNGTDTLSEKQAWHLNNVLGHFNDRCIVCGSKIPFRDRFALYDETDCCSDHFR